MQFARQRRLVCTLAGEPHAQQHGTLGSHGETDGIESTLGGQMHARCVANICMALICIPKIAVHAQNLVSAARLCRLGPAMAGKTISQRQALAMWPEFAYLEFSRNKVGTSHPALLTMQFYIA